MEKEKILSGLCKQVPPVSNGLFQHQEEMIKKCPGIFYQNFYSVGSAQIFSQNRSVNSLKRDLSIDTTFNLGKPIRSFVTHETRLYFLVFKSWNAQIKFYKICEIIQRKTRAKA